MENKNTFAEAKVGDRVWSFDKDWGTVTNFKVDEDDGCIEVKFDYNEIIAIYLLDGRFQPYDKNPSLYWDEIKFEIPKKPFDLKVEFEKLEVKEFKHRESNSYLFYNYSFEMWCFAETETSYSPTLLFFETETEKLDRFLNLLNEHKIAPEQLRPLLLEKLTEKKKIAGTEFIDSRFNKVK